MTPIAYFKTWVTRLREFLRFATVGCLSVAINLLIIVTLTTGLRINYLVSIAVCFCTVTFVSFWFNRAWTFRKKHRALAGDLSRYIIVTVVQLFLCLAGSSVLVGYGHVPYQIAVLLLSILFAPINYLFHRAWSFQLQWSEESHKSRL